MLNNNLSRRQRTVLAVNSIRQRVPWIGLKGSLSRVTESRTRFICFKLNLGSLIKKVNVVQFLFFVLHCKKSAYLYNSHHVGIKVFKPEC